MQFQKGAKRLSNAGRKKGTPNKTTLPIREAFKNFLDHNLPKVQKDFDKMEPKDRVNFIINMAEYCIPKLQRVENLNFDMDAALEKLNDEQLRVLGEVYTTLQD